MHEHTKPSKTDTDVKASTGPSHREVGLRHLRSCSSCRQRNTHKFNFCVESCCYCARILRQWRSLSSERPAVTLMTPKGCRWWTGGFSTYKNRCAAVLNSLKMWSWLKYRKSRSFIYTNARMNDGPESFERKKPPRSKTLILIWRAKLVTRW